MRYCGVCILHKQDQPEYWLFCNPRGIPRDPRVAPRGPWAALAALLLLLSGVPFRLPLLLLLCLLGPLLPLFSPGALLPPLPLLPLLFPLFPPPLLFLVLVSFLLFALSVSSWSATPATVIA